MANHQKPHIEIDKSNSLKALIAPKAILSLTA